MELNILTATEDIEVFGTGPVKSGSATISNGAYILALLSRIYSDPEGSICREIASNIFDAYMKAYKVTGDESFLEKPGIVRLFVDDSGNHFIEFVDNGIGISPEVFTQIYMSYGESDKRESNDYTGAFGLGSKSPLSYNSYFNVITRSEGKSYNYLIYETSTGVDYDLVSEGDTEEVNGTVVRIPLKSSSEVRVWEKKLQEQLSYFSKIIFMNFPNLSNNYEIVEFNTFIFRKDRFKEDPNGPLHIVLGEVYYPLELKMLSEKVRRSLSHGFNVALKFEIGELKPLPSREALEYNQKNIKKLEEKLLEFYDEIDDIILNEKNTTTESLYEAFSFIKRKEDNRETFTDRVILGSDEEIHYSINKTGFFDDREVGFNYNCNGVEVKIPNTKLLSLNGLVTPILRDGSYENEFKLTVFKENNFDNSKLVDFYTQRDRKQNIIIDTGSSKLKKHERMYLNEEQPGVKRVLLLNNFKVLRQKFKGFVKHNPHILKLTRLEKKELYSSLLESYKKDIFGMNCKLLSEFNIPDDYGKIRTTVTRTEGTLVIYSLNEIFSGKRQELDLKLHLEKDNVVCIFGTEQEKQEVWNLKRNGVQFMFPGKRINFFYTSQRNVSILKDIKNCFYAIDLTQEDGFLKTPKGFELLSLTVRHQLQGELSKKYLPDNYTYLKERFTEFTDLAVELTTFRRGRNEFSSTYIKKFFEEYSSNKTPDFIEECRQKLDLHQEELNNCYYTPLLYLLLKKNKVKLVDLKRTIYSSVTIENKLFPGVKFSEISNFFSKESKEKVLQQIKPKLESKIKSLGEDFKLIQDIIRYEYPVLVQVSHIEEEIFNNFTNNLSNFLVGSKWVTKNFLTKDLQEVYTDEYRMRVLRLEDQLKYTQKHRNNIIKKLK